MLQGGRPLKVSLCVAESRSGRQWVAVCCSVLQCVAVCCSVLQSDSKVRNMAPTIECVALCCIVLQCVAVRLKWVAV